uniref:NADH-ubiquinone oxidoreductase chain 2 n=1 Tax=Lyreidus brevifrons TaxID=1617980 RepID=A0A0D3QU45_LYRBR|nr:NADH dehydrogenase subunit 2 [Lyreidus brevifrons]AJR19302.1 NADH dehydrogenase subunit 2 [Lyreidus brevifrons]
MIFPPILLLFYFLYLLGTLLSISASSWFGAWVGLDLNMLSFIPLISMKTKSPTPEPALNTFLVQARGYSAMIIAGYLIFSNLFISTLMLFMTPRAKLWSAPVQFWFPQVMEGLNWRQAILLLTIQKIAPMSLSPYLMFDPLLISITVYTGIFVALVGALGGGNQMYNEKLMAFSSINHMSWMLIAMTLSECSWIMCFLFYSIISSSVALLFHGTQAVHITEMIQHLAPSSLMVVTLPTALLSLGGLRPFSGFIPKWMMIQMMICHKMILPLSILLASALVTLYFYVRIFNMFLTFPSPNLKWVPKYLYFKPEMPLFILSLNLLGMLTPSLFFLF